MRVRVHAWGWAYLDMPGHPLTRLSVSPQSRPILSICRQILPHRGITGHIRPYWLDSDISGVDLAGPGLNAFNVYVCMGLYTYAHVVRPGEHGCAQMSTMSGLPWSVYPGGVPRDVRFALVCDPGVLRSRRMGRSESPQISTINDCDPGHT